nr:type II secretion system protein [Bacilli bacterium]
MNKKGFTLVELICSVAILVLLVTMTTIIILNVVENTNEELDEGTKLVLYNAAESYLIDNASVGANGTYTVTVATLLNNDLISETFIDSQDNKIITKDSCVKVNVTNGAMTYEFSYECN